MNAKVVVTTDAAGNVITQSKRNQEYGFIRVSQMRADFDNRGFASIKEVTALIHGTVESLKKFGWHANQEIDGKIVIREQLKPFNTKEPERDLKFAGDTGVICTHEGQPIYRKHFYTLNGAASDVLVEHTNKEEIYAAIETDKDVENSTVETQEPTMQPNTDFDL
jgi:hypothetical protein